MIGDDDPDGGRDLLQADRSPREESTAQRRAGIPARNAEDRLHPREVGGPVLQQALQQRNLSDPPDVRVVEDGESRNLLNRSRLDGPGQGIVGGGVYQLRFDHGGASLHRVVGHY